MIARANSGRAFRRFIDALPLAGQWHIRQPSVCARPAFVVSGHPPALRQEESPVPGSKSQRPIVLLTDEQVAQQLNCSIKTVRRRRYRGELTTFIDGGLRRIPSSSVEDYIRRNSTGGAA
jgi:excisionase family DNA binding protein